MDELYETLTALKELADRAGTPAEAEAAATKLQSLLLKHNLSMDWRWDPGRDIKMMTLAGHDSIWRAKLLGVVASAHLCRAVRTMHPEGFTVEYTVFGHRHNLEVIKEVYPWLCRVVPDTADAAAAKLSPLEILSVGREDWLHAFRLGMIDGIAKAYARSRQDLHSESGLVPIDASVDEFVKKLYPDATTHYLGGEADASSYWAGEEAGLAINTDRQMKGADRENIAIDH